MNSTFSDNSAGLGGGIANGGGTLNISNSTVSSNSAPLGDGVVSSGFTRGHPIHA